MKKFYSISIYTRQLLVADCGRSLLSRNACVPKGRFPDLRIDASAAFPIAQWHRGFSSPFTVTSSHRILTCFPIICIDKSWVFIAAPFGLVFF